MFIGTLRFFLDFKVFCKTLSSSNMAALNIAFESYTVANTFDISHSIKVKIIFLKRTKLSVRSKYIDFISPSFFSTFFFLGPGMSIDCASKRGPVLALAG